jgi:hypothetical protein
MDKSRLATVFKTSLFLVKEEQVMLIDMGKSVRQKPTEKVGNSLLSQRAADAELSYID